MKKMIGLTLSSLLLISGFAFAKTTHQNVVDINHANQAALSAVQGISESKAKAIIDYRKSHGSFKTVHDLVNVKGISEKSLQNLLKKNPKTLVAKK